MKVGDPLPIRVHDVTAPPMAVLARVLRDPNPIHLDAAAAAGAGLGDRVINQGPANLAYVMDMLATAFPGHRLAKVESRYLANVRDGDRVEAGGTIALLEADRVSCDAWLRIQGGADAVSVKATLVRREA